MVSKRARGWANQAGMPSQAITQNGSKKKMLKQMASMKSLIFDVCEMLLQIRGRDWFLSRWNGEYHVVTYLSWKKTASYYSNQSLPNLLHNFKMCKLCFGWQSVSSKKKKKNLTSIMYGLKLVRSPTQCIQKMNNKNEGRKSHDYKVIPFFS